MPPCLLAHSKLPLKSNLYVTGLVFEYHQGVFNNFDRNSELWNTTLSKHLVNEAKDEKAKQLSANYLPMLLQLRKVYGQKGEQKKPADSLELKSGHGIVGDAHAGDWHRQVSLLAEEDISTIRGKGIEISFGDFAENITTEGVDLSALPIGTRLHLGEAELEVTQIGKECHHGCAIYQTVGDCVMPRNGIFAKVIKGGVIT